MQTTPVPDKFLSSNPLIQLSADWSPTYSSMKDFHPVPRWLRLIVNGAYDHTIGKLSAAIQRSAARRQRMRVLHNEQQLLRRERAEAARKAKNKPK